MNKLYIIKWLLPNGYEISRCTFWNMDLVTKKIENNPDWDFELVENNDVQMVWEAR